MIGRGAPLPGFDEALVDRLLAHTRDIGIDVLLESEVTEVTRVGSTDVFRVHMREDSRTVDADLAGRVPNTARLGAGAGS